MKAPRPPFASAGGRLDEPGALADPAPSLVSETQASRDLLERPLPEGYREEWARHFARRDRGIGADRVAQEWRIFLIFRLGQEWFALPSNAVLDVVELRPIHSLPHRRDAIVQGLVSVRGELLVCVSLIDLFGIRRDPLDASASRAGTRGRLVVIGTGHHRVVFVADEVHGLERSTQGAALAVPATLSAAAASFTTSMLPWNGRAVGCLDEALVLDALDRSLA